MNTQIENNVKNIDASTWALEREFPIEQISELAMQESWRKEINRPIYHIHKWWATRLGSVFRAIILSALSPERCDVWEDYYREQELHGKVVLDPFMGSGTTLGEAIKLGAKAIGCDTNPISTFLVKQAFNKVSENELRLAFAELEKSVAGRIRYYYQTQDPESNRIIPVLYYFWVKMVTTPSGESIPLFSRYIFSQNAYPKKKPLAYALCPVCWEILATEYDITQLQCPHCGHVYNPQTGPVNGAQVTDKSGTVFRIKDLVSQNNYPPKHRLYALLALKPSGEKKYLPIRKYDIDLYSEAQEQLKVEKLPLPTYLVRGGHNTDQALGYNYREWSQFFNERQLLGLGLLLQEIMKIDNKNVQEQMLCLFSSTLEFNNLFCSFKGEGTGAVRHMFSNHILKPERTPLENSIWGTEKSSGTFSTLFESRLVPAKRYLEKPFDLRRETDLFGNHTETTKIVVSKPIAVESTSDWGTFTKSDNRLLLFNGSSAALAIPDNAVDAIITDPPYFDFIHYSELSDFFFAWLSPVLRERYPWFDKTNSFCEGEVQQSDPRQFSFYLSLVFKECHRVLKQNGVMAFSFHHSKADGWAAIGEAIIQSGFEVVAAHPVHAELMASSPKAATKEPISIDAILVCKKREDIEESTKFDIVKYYLERVGRLTSAGLRLSLSDHYVIKASCLLIPVTHYRYDYERSKTVFSLLALDGRRCRSESQESDQIDGRIDDLSRALQDILQTSSCEKLTKEAT